MPPSFSLQVNCGGSCPPPLLFPPSFHHAKQDWTALLLQLLLLNRKRLLTPAYRRPRQDSVIQEALVNHSGLQSSPQASGGYSSLTICSWQSALVRWPVWSWRTLPPDNWALSCRRPRRLQLRRRSQDSTRRYALVSDLSETTNRFCFLASLGGSLSTATVAQGSRRWSRDIPASSNLDIFRHPSSKPTQPPSMARETAAKAALHTVPHSQIPLRQTPSHQRPLAFLASDETPLIITQFAPSACPALGCLASQNSFASTVHASQLIVPSPVPPPPPGPRSTHLSHLNLQNRKLKQ